MIGQTASTYCLSALFTMPSLYQVGIVFILRSNNTASPVRFVNNVSSLSASSLSYDLSLAVIQLFLPQRQHGGCAERRARRRLPDVGACTAGRTPRLQGCRRSAISRRGKGCRSAGTALRSAERAGRSCAA